MSPPNADPQGVVRAVFDALSAGEWERVADFVRPQALREFREHKLLFVRAAMRERPRTTDEMARDMEGAPEAVVQFFAAQEAKSISSRPRWTPGVFGARDLDELESFSSRLLFVRWLAATYEGNIPWQAFGGSRCLIRREVLGCVEEERGNRRLAHVVFRIFDSLDWESRSRVAMATLRCHPARGWMIGTDLELLVPARKG